MRQVMMKQRLMLMRMTRLQLLRRQQMSVLLVLLRLRLRSAGLAVLRRLHPTVHHRMTRVARVIVVAGIAVAVATAEVREGGSVRAVRAGVVVGGMARVVARLKTVEAGVAVVGALIQDRRDRRDARPSASFAVLRYLYDYRSLARTGKRKINKSFNITFNPRYSTSGSFIRRAYRNAEINEKYRN